MSLSLVAYGSSDENSDSSLEDNDVDSSVRKPVERSKDVSKTLTETKPPGTGNSTSVNDSSISDEDGEVLVSVNDVDDVSSGLKLPPARHQPTTLNSDSSDTTASRESGGPSMLGLPAPKPIDRTNISRPAFTEDDELEEMVKPKAAELAQRVQPPEKKKKKTIQITAPSISNYDSDEEDEPIKKKLKPSSGCSGLFALLPQPKHISIKEAGRTLLPHTLTRKPAPASKPAPKPTCVGSATTDLVKPPATTMAQAEDSDDDEDSSKSGNYFSIGDDGQQGALLSASSYSVTSSLSTLPAVKRQQSLTDSQPTQVNETPSQFDSSSGGSLADVPLHFKSMTSTSFVGPSGPTRQEQARSYPQMMEAVNNEDYNMAGLDEMYPNEADTSTDLGVPPEELLKLQGKRKWGKEEIKIIDVQADYQTNPVELTKHLTEEVDMVSHSKKKKDQPTFQQKRKHQITYLAHMAKEREFDLKNQWAQNKMTKRQSQSKYGF